MQRVKIVVNGYRRPQHQQNHQADECNAVDAQSQVTMARITTKRQKQKRHAPQVEQYELPNNGYDNESDRRRDCMCNLFPQRRYKRSVRVRRVFELPYAPRFSIPRSSAANLSSTPLT